MQMACQQNKTKKFPPPNLLRIPARFTYFQIKVLPLSTFDDRLRLQVARAIYGDPVFTTYRFMSVPPIHMRWRMTPILRASATLARLAPRRLETATAQA